VGPPAPDAFTGSEADTRGQVEESSPLHRERLEAVAEAVRAAGVSTLLDAGCGSGALLRMLAGEPRLRRIVGLDESAVALAEAKRLLGPPHAGPGPEIELHHGSVLELDRAFPGAEAVTLVEVIEHLAPGELARLEERLFRILRPRLVVITTPNRDYNELLGVPAGELRHTDHRFEWGRATFRAWSERCAAAGGYEAAFHDVGQGNAWYGSPTQMAVLTTPARARGAGSHGLLTRREV
jgi:small RNA 2'-O-methyltransferase